MSFSDDFTFTRGTGATRINAAGLIVGVDFSSTSNTIGTGAKTFTLTADANVNRDWPVGSAVRVVDQVSGNTMEGTVTTYTPSTQALVLDITSVTGSGTFTNWRIGSLEVRRDADGVLREPMRSNLISFSSDFTNAVWVKFNAGTGVLPVVNANVAISPDGSQNADEIILSTGAGTTNADQARVAQQIATTAISYTSSIWLKGSVGGENLQIVGPQQATQLITLTTQWQRFTITAIGSTTAFAAVGVQLRQGVNGTINSSVTIYAWNGQLELGSSNTSDIPTTTVAVTRNADTFTFTPAAIAKFRQGQGALIVEANASDAGTAQRAALRLTGPSGEIRFGKQGVATSGNFTKMAEGGDVQLLGNATQGITNNGLEYGLFAPINTHTGVVQGPFNIPAITYDGNSRFGGLSVSEEQGISGDLATLNTTGLGGRTLNGCHHNGSRFLIATGTAGIVGISTDGLSYRRVNTPVITQACTEVTSGLVGATLRNVIVGNAGFIATSDDNGETWTSRTSGVAQGLLAVTRSTTNFIAAVDTATSTIGIRTSADGITWAAANSNVTRILIDVHANGATVVAVGQNGAITVSLDNGATWAQATSSQVVTTQTLNGVHYNASAGLWVAVGNNGTIITATDPTGTWTLQTSGTAGNLNEVTYFNNLWVVNNAGGGVLTSPNATAWTTRSTNIAGAGVGIAASATRLIITGTSGQFGSSEDGLTYTSRTNNNATLNGIAYGAGVYVSVGNAVNGSGYIATIDGAGTVTRRVSGFNNNLTNSKFVRGAFYVTGTNTVLLRSTDGATYTPLTIGGIGFTTNDIADSGTLMVTVGSAARYSLSSNGTTFGSSLQIAAAGGQQLNAVEFANGIFVAGGNAGVLFTGVESGGAITWTARTSGVIFAIKSIIYSTRDQRWYAAGDNGTLLYSEDNGVTWASVNNAGFGAVQNTTLQANRLLPQWKSGRNTMALSYKANEVIVGLNGVAVTDTANTIPSITAGVLGESFNGKIKSAKFQPNPLTLVEVQAITGVTK